MAQRPGKKSDALSQWTRLTPTMKVGVMFLVAALLGLVYWQFLLKDLRAEKDSEQSSRDTLLRTQAGLNTRIDQLEKLKTQRDALETEVAGLEFALPSDAELNSFLDHIQTKAGDAGVSFKSWTNEAEVLAGKYIKVPMTVTVEGNFYQLMNYMYLLGPQEKGDADAAGSAKFDRIVTVENMKITEANLRNDEILLTATFTASTFRQEAGPPPAAPAPGAAAPAAGGRPPTPGAPPTPAPAGAPAGAAPAAPAGATTPAPATGDATKPGPFRGAGAAGTAGNHVVEGADEAAKKAEEEVKKAIKEAGEQP